MSTAIATQNLHQKLAEKPKGALVQEVLRIRNGFAKKKAEIKHAGQMTFGAIVAAAGGAAAGVLAAKLPTIPNTNIPSDAALGVTITVLCALDVFDGADPYINDFAKGLIGAGTKDFVLKMIQANP